MKHRFVKLFTRPRAFLVGGLLIGAALAPVGAQQVAPADRQLAVRSDRAVYLIMNGQRRWVPTIAITDEELNAYPEGEPVSAGLAPPGSQSTGSTSAPPATRASSSPTNTATGAPPSTGTTTPTGATSQADPQLPIVVDIDGRPKFEPGERIIVNVQTASGATCELAVKWPDGTEVDQEKKTADSIGRCRYSIEIPATATAGPGVLKGIVRQSGQMNRQDVDFEIIPSN